MSHQPITWQNLNAFMVMVNVIRMGKKGDLSDLVVDAIP